MHISEIVNIDYFVAVQCSTYNHSQYIKDTLNGFILQHTDFPFVCVVMDDCSTDGEQTIIREWMESNTIAIKTYDLELSILYIATSKTNANCSFAFYFLKRNLYCDSRKGEMFEEWLTYIKYVAMCEGDDYWIDPYKLQKQVDFMESHPDYSECFTNTLVKYSDHEEIAINHVWDTYAIEDIINSNALNMDERGDTIQSCGHTSSVLYRRPKDGLPNWISKCYIGDEPLFIALGQYGKAKFINKVATVYRAGVGVSSRNFDFEVDWFNRIKMYEIINEGLGYQYESIINPIIAEYHYKLFKLYAFHKERKEAISQLCKALKQDKRILLKRIIKR